jgi:hypothetical protein
MSYSGYALSVCLAVTTASSWAPASADEAPAADKSGFEVFDPTPDADLRSFSTDRPSKGFTPITVDAGHFQYETDLLGYLYDSYSPDHVRTREFFTADPVVKLGLTNTLEVGVALGGYQNYQLHGGGVSQDYDGFGDVILRPKLNVLGDDGGPVAIALAPFFKIPTATRGLGNGVGEFGLTVPVTFPLPFETTGGFVPEIDDFKNPANTGRHAAFTGSVSLSRSLTEKFGVTVEYWWQTQAAGSPTQYTLDLVATYALTPSLQLDVGTFIGLNKAAPDLVEFIGLSQRF